MDDLGLTFMESLVTLLLLTSILAFGTSIYSNADKIATLAIHKKIAVEMITAKLEELKKGGYAALPDPANPIPVVGISLEGTPAELSLAVNNIDETPLDGSTDYKEVIATIQWLEVKSQTPRIVSLTTFMAP